MAEDSLYTSLDDIIKKNKQQGHGGRHEKRRRVRFYGSGPSRTGPSRRSINPRMIPYSMPQRRFTEGDVKMLGEDHGTKLFVSNLDYGVSNDDIRIDEDNKLNEKSSMVVANPTKDDALNDKKMKKSSRQEKEQNKKMFKGNCYIL
ncbi:hypothetical protein FXO37_32385 [Capsicum annuum]|nr:hypothetical protein FXO37_32385 [Capsicum annuum]